MLHETYCLHFFIFREVVLNLNLNHSPSIGLKSIGRKTLKQKEDVNIRISTWRFVKLSLN